jgi:hypothetical protein
MRLTYRAWAYLAIYAVIAVAWILRCIVMLPRDLHEFRTTPMPMVRKAIALAWVLTVLAACTLAGVGVFFWGYIVAHRG